MGLIIPRMTTPSAIATALCFSNQLIHPEMTTWRATKTAADKNEAAVKKIKALLPDDVSPCTFGGVVLKRDKRGLGIKESK